MPWLFYEAQQSSASFSRSAVCGVELGIWTKLFSQQQRAAVCVGGLGLLIHLCCPEKCFLQKVSGAIKLLSIFLSFLIYHFCLQQSGPMLPIQCKSVRSVVCQKIGPPAATPVSTHSPCVCVQKKKKSEIAVWLYILQIKSLSNVLEIIKRETTQDLLQCTHHVRRGGVQSLIHFI